MFDNLLLNTYILIYFKSLILLSLLPLTLGLTIFFWFYFFNLLNFFFQLKKKIIYINFFAEFCPLVQVCLQAILTLFHKKLSKGQLIVFKYDKVLTSISYLIVIRNLTLHLLYSGLPKNLKFLKNLYF